MKVRGTLAVLGSVLFAACGTPSGPPAFRDADYPGVLRQPEDLELTGLWRQHVTARWRDGEQSFDAALQNIDNQLTVVGLSPVGQPGFVFQLTGEAITSENNSGRPLPFPPRFILLDVQRVFYPWLGDGVGIFGKRVDGDHRAEADGERVVEVWRQGRLRERRFERLDQQPPGVMTVTYQWDDSMRAPHTAVLDNRWFGYSLTVETVEENLLAPQDPPATPERAAEQGG